MNIRRLQRLENQVAEINKQLRELKELITGGLPETEKPSKKTEPKKETKAPAKKTSKKSAKKTSKG